MACSTPGIREMGDAVGKKETSSNQLCMPAFKKWSSFFNSANQNSFHYFQAY